MASSATRGKSPRKHNRKSNHKSKKTQQNLRTPTQPVQRERAQKEPSAISQLLQPSTPPELRRERLRWQLSIHRARRQLHKPQHAGDLAPLFTSLLAGNANNAVNLLKTNSLNTNSSASPTPGHDFSWLHDLAAEGSTHARQTARKIILEWIHTTPQVKNFSPLSPSHPHPHQIWQPEIVARRLFSWCLTWPFFGASGDLSFRRTLLAALNAQGNWLANVAPAGLRGQPATTQHAACLLAQLMVQKFNPTFDARFQALKTSLNQTLRTDGDTHGGIYERSPDNLLTLWLDLSHLIAALQHCAHAQAAEELRQPITMLGETLATLNHGEPGLALFHGSSANQQRLHSLRPGHLPPSKRHAAMGFERLHANGVCVLIDCATQTPPPQLSGHYHLAPAAMEVSVEGERIFGNCGSCQTDPWRQALRQPAAHSCLSLATADREIMPGSLEPRSLWYGAPAQIHYGEAHLERREDETATELIYRHQAWRNSLQATSERRLHLRNDGRVLRGQERLRSPQSASFAVRFHLDPRIDSLLTRSRTSAILRTQNGAIWRLRLDPSNNNANTEPALLTHEESFVSLEGRPEPTTQWVMRGVHTQGETILNWSLTREGKS